MRGRRRRLFIHRICNGNEEWIKGDADIANAACEHFAQIFSGKDQRINEDILQCVPRFVTPAQNQILQSMPTMEELKYVVFSMNPNSAAGLDGMNGKFFQSR